MRRTLLIIMALSPLAGCGPTGPVFGSWAGETPGPITTGLTLYGPPGATSGSYLVQITVAATQIGGGSGLTTWSGGGWPSDPMERR